MNGTGKTKEGEMTLDYINNKRSQLFALASKYGLTNDETKNIIQDIYLKLLNKAGLFRGESKFSTFAYSVATNEILMYLRSKKKYERYDCIDSETYLKADSLNPEENYLKNEREQNIRDLLESCPEVLKKEDREIFEAEIKIIQEDDFATTLTLAEMLNTSIPNVKTRRHRMRLKLRRYFDRDNFF